MGKKGRWRVKGYDGAGEAILMRRAPRVEPERKERNVEHRSGLRRLFAIEGHAEQDAAIRDALGRSR